MATTRGVDLTAHTGDTGNVTILAAQVPPSGPPETLATCRIRMKTNTPGNGQYLFTLDWFDGVGAQQYNVALNATASNYLEAAINDGEIWWDVSQPLTYRVRELTGDPTPGDVDVLFLYSLQ